MRARVLFAEVAAISTVLIAGPASAKPSITEVNITGPGLGGGLTIEAPGVGGLSESGIDLAGGLARFRADSVEELRLTSADLGPRYLVTYRFEFGDDLIRQDLFPYAKGGPVTYTPPGQKLTGVGINMGITAGWYQSSRGFLRYLMDHGLPERSPVAPLATGEAAGTAPGARTLPSVGIVVILVGFAALSLATLAVRRRVSRWPRVVAARRRTTLTSHE